MKLVYQPLGTVSLVGIESNDTQEIIEQYYSLWNHEATGGKLHWMSDNFAYITSNEEALEKYFVNSSFHLLLNKYPEKYTEDSVMPDARKLGARRLAELKENSEAFMPTNPIITDYSLGRVEARENPAQSPAFDEEAYKQKSSNDRSSLAYANSYQSC